MSYLLNRLNSIRRIWCFSYSLSAMALSEWEFMSDDDPWKVSAFVSAIVELFLSILLLLGAAIAFITSRFAKFFGLEPPCTYIGCSHPLQSECLKSQLLPTSPFCKSKDLCRGDFCPHCRPLSIHAKLHGGSIQEDGSCNEAGKKRSAFCSMDHNAREQDQDASREWHETRCYCSDSTLYKRQNQRKGLKCLSFSCTASNGELDKDVLPFLSSRSGSESSGGFNADDHCEISQALADSEEEWAWKGTNVKRGNNVNYYPLLSHDCDALKRNAASEDHKEKMHGISPPLFKGSQVECAELSPLYAVRDEVEELKVSKNNFEQCKQEDDEPAVVAIHVGGDIQGTCGNVSQSTKETQHLSVLMSKEHQELIDQSVDGDDCFKKGQVAVHLSLWELCSQEAIVEGIKEAGMDHADARCEMDGRLSEGEEGELFMKDSGQGVKDAFDDTITTKDEPAFTNALPKCGQSSEHAEEMALSASCLEAEDDEEEFIAEEAQEEGSDALKLALQSERSMLAALEAELENERNAAAVATSEAMAMISRLQEEKSAMQMEVTQLQRMSEEKADYDEQAMALLKEILFKREKENIVLEKEVELYRETISAEKADELKRSWCINGYESPSIQSLKPLLLTSGEEEFLSPIEAMNQKQALAFSERLYESGTRSAPWIGQSGSVPDAEELNALSVDQNVGKRSTDFPTSVTAMSMSFRVCDNEGRPRYHVDGGLHELHTNAEQIKLGKSVFSTNDEEAQFILERLWVLEEELQKLRGKDGFGCESKVHGIHQSVISPKHGRADKSFTEAWSGQSVSGIKSKEQREEVEIDGVAVGFVPIHDVYEVQSTSNRSPPPFAEEREVPEGFEGIAGNLELPPSGIAESFSPARMARHRISIPPRIAVAKQLFSSDEAPCTPVFTPQAAGWMVGKCLHPDNLYDHQDLQAQSLVSREETGTTKQEIQQLAERLKALEDDRELLRETLESFKHRDVEVNLLQEIAQHLRELRMAGFMRASGGVFAEDVAAISPSKNRVLKKRRYCSGPGQVQMHLLNQKSI